MINQDNKHPYFLNLTGTFSFLQEVIGSNLAGLPPPKLSSDAPFLFTLLSRAHVNVRALKMAIYGLCISAPLSHYLVGLLQRSFAGKTGIQAKVAQILANNLLVAPIQTVGACSSRVLIPDLGLPLYPFPYVDATWLIFRYSIQHTLPQWQSLMALRPLMK